MAVGSMRNELICWCTNFRIARLQDMHAVASRLLRGVAREIGSAHQLGDVRAFPADDDHPDAHADLEDFLVPHETEVGDCLAQLLGDFKGLAFVALHEQYAEFVATEARKSVGPADVVLERCPELEQEAVAGHVSAGVVYDLELVEIEEHDGVCAVLGFGEAVLIVEAVLELAAVTCRSEQICEC